MNTQNDLLQNFVKLSIVTINYNNCAGLQKTINSIVAQTWRDFEWIVIDGGSNDGSKELIEKYQEHFAYWCSEPDKGVYNAMNKGIAKAKGEYLNFMNSGDYFASERVLEDVFDSEVDNDIIFGYMMRLSIDGQPNNASMMKQDVKWYDFFNDTFPHQSSFIKRDLFLKYGLYDETYIALADWKFFILCVVYHKASFRFVPIKISVYECGGLSDREVGKIERDRLRKEMFPQLVMDDVPLIKVTNMIHQSLLCKKLFYILVRIAKLVVR